MTEIILVRHGETEWNVEEIYRGRIDVELSEVGIKQAQLLGRYHSNLKLDAIYSSPLKRALDTANILAKYQNVAVQATDGLMDLNCGEWQGLSNKQVKKLYPAVHQQWRINPHLVKMPGGRFILTKHNDTSYLGGMRKSLRDF